MKFLLNKIGAVTQKTALFAGAATVVGISAVGYMMYSGSDDSGVINAKRTQTVSQKQIAGAGSATYGSKVYLGETASTKAARDSSTAALRGAYAGQGVQTLSDLGGAPPAIGAARGGQIEGLGMDETLQNQSDMFGLNIEDAMRQAQAGGAGTDGNALGNDLFSKIRSQAGGNNGPSSGSGGKGSGATFTPNNSTRDSSARALAAASVKNGSATNVGKSAGGRSAGAFANADTNAGATKSKYGRTIQTGALAEADNINKRLAMGSDGSAGFIGDTYQNAGQNTDGVSIGSNTLTPNDAAALNSIGDRFGNVRAGDGTEGNVFDLLDLKERLKEQREKKVISLMTTFAAAAVASFLVIAALAKIWPWGQIAALALAGALAVWGATVLKAIWDVDKGGEPKVSNTLQTLSTTAVLACMAGGFVAASGILGASSSIAKILAGLAGGGIKLFDKGYDKNTHKQLEKDYQDQQKAYDEKKAAEEAANKPTEYKEGDLEGGEDKK